MTEVETYDVKFKSAGPAPEVLEATLMVLKVGHRLHTPVQFFKHYCVTQSFVDIFNLVCLTFGYEPGCCL